MSSRELTLEDVALTSNTPNVAYSPYGYIIGDDGRAYALTERWFHGVVLAVLYPEVAKEAGFAPPVREDGDVDVFLYQRFELDHGHKLPVLRVSHSLQTGTTMVSAGNPACTEPQLAALVGALRALGLRANDTLTGEEDDMTVTQWVDYLRQRGALNSDEDGEDTADTATPADKESN
jgi:hypothetical protein